MTKPTTGFTDEERRIRVRKAELGLKVSDIALGVGITRQDVSMVIRGKSKSPRYVVEVYRFLGLEMPKGGI